LRSAGAGAAAAAAIAGDQVNRVSRCSAVYENRAFLARRCARKEVLTCWLWV